MKTDQMKNFAEKVKEYLGISDKIVEIDVSPHFDSGANGVCIDIDENNYLILINGNRPLHQILRTIAHEMIHVKQHAMDNLNHFLLEMERLKKNDPSEYHFRMNDPRRYLWWEEEAYSLAPVLVEKFA